MFRLPRDRALINRMGFNNDGAAAVAGRLAHARSGRDTVVLGVNIGKTKVVARGRRGRGRRLREVGRARWRRWPTTWSSTSARRTRPACATSRPWSSCGRCWRRARDGDRTPPRPASRCWSRSPPTSPTTTSSTWPGWRSSSGSTGSSPTNTTISRAGLGTPAAEVEAIGAGGLSGAPVARAVTGGAPAAAPDRRARPHPGLGRRHLQRRRRPRPARRRRHPGPGLHRLRVRRAVVATPDRSRPRLNG